MVIILDNLARLTTECQSRRFGSKDIFLNAQSVRRRWMREVGALMMRCRDTGIGLTMGHVDVELKKQQAMSLDWATINEPIDIDWRDFNIPGSRYRILSLNARDTRMRGNSLHGEVPSSLFNRKAKTCSITSENTRTMLVECPTEVTKYYSPLRGL